ncbi:MAG TPA: DUF2817 domain-containing protein [Deltaproteobacteria bacterium]|nr:DUF2817 domain-containing protein [Deltaproteobacteria bacterium]
MSPDHRRHFFDHYEEAREAFRKAAGRAGAVVSGRAIAARGRRGGELTIDTAYLGPGEPDRVLAVSSGIHGVEGFAGSAIQHQLLTEQLSGLDLPPDTGLLLVHAINPYGFSELRRVNENNVDLNRNFLRHPEDHPESPDYAELFQAINPEEIDPASEESSRKTLFAFAEAHGFPRLQAALTAGQYRWPEGVQFGGIRDEDSNRLLREIAREETRGASSVAWIDFHTGLGESGNYVLISDRPPDDPAYQRGRRWFGDAVESTLSGDSVSAVLNGTLEGGLLDGLPEGVELTTFGAEFGTHEPFRVFWAMRQDNWLEHHGDPDTPLGRTIKQEIVEVFRPNDPVWMNRVLEGGARILEQARNGLTGSARNRATDA